MLRLKDIEIVTSKSELSEIPEGKILMNTINAYSYNMAQKDNAFAEALKNGDYLIPDGMPIVKSCWLLNATSKPVERIAGWDLFSLEMKKTETKSKKVKESFEPIATPETFEVETAVKPKVMFLGSSEHVLSLIKQKAAVEYPNLEIITYSPPYKPVFSVEDSKTMVDAINEANPDLLWIGMTAPKQEKWVYEHWGELNIHCHVGTIGAVFDFYAGTAKRAPESWQRHGFEWLYRLIKEPKRMWRRYVLGNPEFLFRILKEKLS